MLAPQSRSAMRTQRSAEYLASFIPVGKLLPVSSAHSPPRRADRPAVGEAQARALAGMTGTSARAEGPGPDPEAAARGDSPTAGGVRRQHSLPPPLPWAPEATWPNASSSWSRLPPSTPTPAPSRPPEFRPVAARHPPPQLPPDSQGSPSLGRSGHPPRKFLITSFFEPPPPPPGLEETAAAARDAGLVRPLVCPTSAEKLPFLGVSSAMAAAGKQWAPRPVRPPSPPPPGAARRGLPPPLRAFSDSRPRQRRPGPAQPPLGLPPPGPAPLRSRPGRDLATDPRLASAASPCPPGSVWNLQQPRRWGGKGREQRLSGGSASAGEMAAGITPQSRQSG